MLSLMSVCISTHQNQDQAAHMPDTGLPALSQMMYALGSSALVLLICFHNSSSSRVRCDCGHQQAVHASVCHMQGSTHGLRLGRVGLTWRAMYSGEGRKLPSMRL